MAWQPAQVQFAPYELTAVPAVPEASQTGQDGAKRKAGRQKRSSILCQVPWCQSELINEKTYYKRYRICMEHCNMTSMTLDGRRQRFCQQCGRFHDLSEFEATRKSCRRKLKRHNERRRAAPAKGHKWASDSEGDAEADSEEEAEALAVANIKRASGRARAARAPQADDGCTAHKSTASNSGSQAPAAGPASTLESLHQSITERLVHAARGLVSGFATQQAKEGAARWQQLPGSASPPIAMSDDASGSSAATAGPTSSSAQPALKGLGPLPGVPNLQAVAPGAGFQLHLDDMQPMDMSFQGAGGDHDSGLLLISFEAERVPSVAPPLDTCLDSLIDDLPLMGLPGDIAAPVTSLLEPTPQLAQLQQLYLPQPTGHPLVGYSSQDSLMRMSLKVFNCTPEVLLPEVRAELETMLRMSRTMLEGYIRPGCVHVTLCALVDKASCVDAPGGALAVVEDLLARNALGPAAAEDMTLQLGGELVVVKRRRVMAVINTEQSAGLMPLVAAVRPLAVVAAPRVPVLLAGQRIGLDSDLVMVRQGGRNLTVEMATPPTTSSALEVVRCSVLGLAPGCAEVEVQRGAFLGESRPMLVLPDAAATAEVRTLEAGAPGIENVDAFLRDMGLVVAFLQRHTLAEAGLPVPHYTPALLARLQDMACRLVACAVARGWSAVCAMLLPAVCAAGQDAAAALAAMSAPCPGGMNLLHVAAAAGRADMVQQLGEWARRVNAPLAVDVKGPGGGTPMHLAALLPPAQREAVRRALCYISPTVNKLWGLVQADDGNTPEALEAAVEAALGGSQLSSATGISLKSVAGPAEASTAEPSIKCALKPCDAEAAHLPAHMRAAHTNRVRLQAKRKLDDQHMDCLLCEVCALPQTGLGVTVVGAALAIGTGVMAVALHMLTNSAL